MHSSLLPRTESWDFDRLGNWAGDGGTGSLGAAPTVPGYTLTGDIDGTGVDQTTTRTHRADQFNAIETEITDLGETGEVSETFVYDASGNVVFDGLHWYRYDAWGRLCQVFPAGSLTAASFDADGKLTQPPPVINANTSIVHFTYDALGRLIAKQSPWPGMPGEIRTERYLHDGVRRIQEIWRQPATGNGSEGGQNQNNGPPTYVDITEREYVHSPGYVDEYVCEIDTGGTGDTFWWVLQDSNYNVVALVSDGDGSLSRGEVARQYSWSPYGQLLRADIFDSSAPKSRLGHQALFHDRLDADVLSEPMVAFSRQALQNRNRTLLPWLGRFAQRDPIGTGSAVADDHNWYGGISPWPVSRVAPKPPAIFLDGMSRFAYLSSNPIYATDSFGLLSDGLYGPGWGQGGVFLIEDGRIVSPDEARQRSSAARQRGRAKGPRFANLMVWIGQSTGALFGAMYWGDGFSDNAALRETLYAQAKRNWDGTLLGIAGAGAGAEGSVIVSKGVLSGEFDAWSVGQMVMDVAGAALTDALGYAVSAPVMGLAAPIIGATAVYSGFLEYTGEAIWDW